MFQRWWDRHQFRVLSRVATAAARLIFKTHHSDALALGHTLWRSAARSKRRFHYSLVYWQMCSLQFPYELDVSSSGTTSSSIHLSHRLFVAHWWSLVCVCLLRPASSLRCLLLKNVRARQSLSEEKQAAMQSCSGRCWSAVGQMERWWKWVSQ